jgi:hypothetical protein
MKFYIYITNKEIAEVEGIDYAYEVYRKTSELADLLGLVAHLVDGDTGEVLESSDDEDEGESDYEPDADEVGFDPYEGCYTYDC